MGFHCAYGENPRGSSHMVLHRDSTDASQEKSIDKVGLHALRRYDKVFRDKYYCRVYRYNTEHSVIIGVNK